MWEYKVIVWNSSWAPATAEQYLNGLGAQGWELTAVLQSSTHNSASIYLKRKLPTKSTAPRPKAGVETSKSGSAK